MVPLIMASVSYEWDNDADYNLDAIVGHLTTDGKTEYANQVRPPALPCHARSLTPSRLLAGQDAEGRDALSLRVGRLPVRRHLVSHVCLRRGLLALALATSLLLPWHCLAPDGAALDAGVTIPQVIGALGVRLMEECLQLQDERGPVGQRQRKSRLAAQLVCPQLLLQILVAHRLELGVLCGKDNRLQTGLFSGLGCALRSLRSELL